MELSREKSGCRVCVTGGSGYVGSWLVKKLLERGYTVHATLRNLGTFSICYSTTNLIIKVFESVHYCSQRHVFRNDDKIILHMVLLYCKKIKKTKKNKTKVFFGFTLTLFGFQN